MGGDATSNRVYTALVRFQVDPDDFASDPADWTWDELLAYLAGTWPDEHRARIVSLQEVPHER